MTKTITFVYFNPIPKTAEELKKMYRHLTKAYHPDLGGTNEAMRVVIDEFKALFAKLKDIHPNMEGETYTAKTPTSETPEEFIQIIEALIKMEGIAIEIIGRFIWVAGDTKPHKDKIKEMGFKWHSKKIQWYLPYEGYRKYNSKEYTMNDIRSMFGSQEVETEKREYKNNLATALA